MIQYSKNKKFCYIHIPFCESKCKYCRFASIGDTQALKIQTYVSFLCREIGAKYAKSGNTKDTLSSLYFGGGTPSLLSSIQLSTIVNTLKKYTIFSPDIEITIESTPNNITYENLCAWENIGVTRLSMGVQSLNDKTLQEIGRMNKGDILEALENIKDFLYKKERKIQSISLDFIIGLPYVQTGGVENDIAFLLGKYPFITHISVYMLEDYYEVGESIETMESKYENIIYPSNWGALGIAEEKYADEYIQICDFLQKQGFFHYELSNFSKQGFECHHNQAYWNHDEVIAFGLGASGFEKGVRYMNSENFGEYYKNENIFSEILTPHDIFLEKVMFGMRTNGLSHDVYTQLNQQKIEEYIACDLLVLKEKKLVLTPKGVVFLDYILKEII